MSNKDLCKYLMLEQQCIRNRVNCNKDCKSCELGIKLLDQDLALHDAIDIIKSRDPELYFMDTLEQLHDYVEKSK